MRPWRQLFPRSTWVDSRRRSKARSLQKIQERVDHVVGNCRLPEEVDAQLHVVLVEIVEGVDAMRSGSDRLAGARQVIQAIQAYGRHFDHGDWGKSQAL